MRVGAALSHCKAAVVRGAASFGCVCSSECMQFRLAVWSQHSFGNALTQSNPAVIKSSIIKKNRTRPRVLHRRGASPPPLRMAVRGCLPTAPRDAEQTRVKGAHPIINTHHSNFNQNSTQKNTPRGGLKKQPSFRSPPRISAHPRPPRAASPRSSSSHATSSFFCFALFSL